MAGINLDAELDKFYPDPQQETNKIFCDYCGDEIIEGQSYYEIPGFGVFHSWCMDHYKINL